MTGASRRRGGIIRAVISVGAVMAIVGVMLSVFVGGRSQHSSTASTAAQTTGAPTTAAAVPAPAKESCASFDTAVARLAVKDNKGFIDGMTSGATSAQAAAAQDSRWQLLVSAFASFASDLAANDATKVLADLNAINQVCASVRGPRVLVLNASP